MIRALFLNSILFLTPVLVFAQGTQGRTATTVIQEITRTIGNLMFVIIALTLVVFLWGIVMYVIKDSEIDKAKAIKYMTNGLISLFVMLAIWGLVYIIDSFIGGGITLFVPLSK